MRIAFLVTHPTQFEGPFFQFVAKTAADNLHVIYSNPDASSTIFDPELSASVSWGIDLLKGYSYSVMPQRKRLRWLINTIRREKYDLLIVNGYSRLDYFVAALCARMSRTPVALRLDSVSDANASRSKKLLKRGLFSGFSRLYQHFFAIGTLTIEYLEGQGIKRNRISLFSYTVDNDYFKQKSSLTPNERNSLRAKYDLPLNGPIVLSVAKFHEREAPWDLLKAFCGMPKPRPTLLLVGDGSERERLEDYARRHGAADVIFTGYVPYPELPAVYGLVDVFVHPAHNEPWGVSVQEALACGLPVVASSKVGAAHDLVIPNRNGAIYKVGDANDLADKLHQVLESSNPASIREENDRILSNWNYASTWRNVVEAYRLIGLPL